MPESARRQREREIKLELLQNADMYNPQFSFLHFLIYSIVVFQLLIMSGIQYSIVFLHSILILNQIKLKNHLQL
jgi:hypothetical protein